MLTLALVALLGVGDTAPEGAPYTDPAGLCIPRMVAVAVPAAEVEVEHRDGERQPTCDESRAASDPRCRLRSPPPPTETTFELRIKSAAWVTDLSLPARMPLLLGERDDSDHVRTGFSRRIDRPPR